MRPLYIIFAVTLLSSCQSNTSKNEINVIDSSVNSTEVIKKEKIDNRYSANWKNPVINPLGSNLGEYVRALFITGQEEKLWRFFWNESTNSVPQESPYELLKSKNWGYKIDFTQLRWQPDSIHFKLYYKTNINNTSGIEEINGIIENDTARILSITN